MTAPENQTPRGARQDSARAFAPGNVSGVFKIVADPDPAKAHSLGWGFTVADGVEVEVIRQPTGESSVTFNGECINFPTVLDAVGRLTDDPLAVTIESKLPLSSGFGLSGASAYAACIATNALIDARKTNFELATISHIAEVENLTGLGDVCAQHMGGCLAKLVPGNPLDAVAIQVEPQPVYWRYFSPISTREVLADESRHQRINVASDAALETITKLMHSSSATLFERLTDVALGFATSSGLLSDARVKQGIAQARAAGGAATMIMLGNAVFSTVPFEGCSETHMATTPGRLVT